MLKTNIPSYFKKRRDKLMARAPEAAFLLPAAPLLYRNDDVEFPYRQESNLYFLSGFDEEGAWLVLVPTKDAGKSYKTVLFVLERDRTKELWNGERYGVDRALSLFGADEAYVVNELEPRLLSLLASVKEVFYRFGKSEVNDRLLQTTLEKVKKSKGRTGLGLLPVRDPVEHLGELRLFKSKEELEIMREAARISVKGHETIMRELRPGMNEADVANLLEYTFRKEGAERLGYGSIVAGGKNACCLHYRHNNEPLKDGMLLLIDAGAEKDFYTADITRTMPVGQRFSKEQEAFYSIVLRAQKEVLQMVKPGVPYASMHERAIEVQVEGLLSLGLLSGTKEDIIRSKGFMRYYPHGTGHYLGMDVHDVGLYVNSDGSPRLLEEGMCFTIEPGLYGQIDDRDCPDAYKGIGIRIEDDIHVTATGSENLTGALPREIDDILRLRK